MRTPWSAAGPRMTEPMTLDSSLLNRLRWAGWFIVVGCVAVVAASYSSLPDEIPLSRWTSAPRSPLLAVRVPLINLLSLGLVDVLSASVARVRGFEGGRRLRLVLLVVVSVKAVLEAMELLLLPSRSTVVPLILAVIVATGLVLTLRLARPLWTDGRWAELVPTRSEYVACVVLLSGIFLLNLPIGLG